MNLNPNYRWMLLRRVWKALLTLTMVAGSVLLGSCGLLDGREAEEALSVVQDYLLASQTGDLERARGYWTDVNNPGGAWTMVAERDMKHVTLEHSESFREGVEVENSEYKRVKGLDKKIGVIRMEVRVQPEGVIRKLEIGLVRHEGRWFIYSIYPGTW